MASGDSVDAEQLLKDGHTLPHQSDSPSCDEVRTSGAESVANIPAPAAASEESLTCIPETPAQDVTVPEADRSSDSEYPMDSDDESTSGIYDPVDCLMDYILHNSEATAALASDLDLSFIIEKYGSLPRDSESMLQLLQSKRPPIQVDETGFGEFEWESEPSPIPSSQMSDSDTGGLGLSPERKSTEDA